MKLVSQLVRNSILSLLLVSPAFAGLSNILADGGKVKPSIKVSETYSEKVVTEKTPGEPTVREKVPHYPVKVTVVANIEGFDISTVNSDTPISLNIGDLTVTPDLGDANEAKDGVFPAGKTKATFDLEYAAPGPNGTPVPRKGARVTVSWAKNKLVITASVKSMTFFGASGVAATDFIGLYVDESPEGTKPSGSKKFEESRNCTVSFAGLTGNRTVILKGTSTTKAKKFGKGDEAEVIELESVKLKGSTGPVAVLPD